MVAPFASAIDGLMAASPALYALVVVFVMSAAAGVMYLVLEGLFKLIRGRLGAG